MAAEDVAEDSAAPVDEPEETAGWRLGRFLTRLVFTLFLLRPRVVGRERLVDQEGSLVVVARGEGRIDPAVLAGYFPAPLVLVGPSRWEEGYPVGWVSRAMGHVHVRESAEEVREDLLRRLERREIHCGVLVDASLEGPGGLDPVALAIESGAALVPVRVGGTREVAPEGAWIPTFSRIVLRVGPPLDLPDPSKGEALDREAVRAALARALEVLEGDTDSPGAARGAGP